MLRILGIGIYIIKKNKNIKCVKTHIVVQIGKFFSLWPVFLFTLLCYVLMCILN